MTETKQVSPVVETKQIDTVEVAAKPFENSANEFASGQ